MCNESTDNLCKSCGHFIPNVDDKTILGWCLYHGEPTLEIDDCGAWISPQNPTFVPIKMYKQTDIDHAK